MQAVPAPKFANILCCMCGASIQPNPSNMCVTCLRGQVDITDGLPKQVVMHWCKECNRYLRPPWLPAELESRELLAICLKKIKGLNKVKLVDASFVWTEPHSRRIKVKLTIQKEVLNGTILQQSFIVEFLIQTMQCDDCKKTYTPHTWVAACQARQKVDHKRTFFYLEQVILKHNAHEKTVSVKALPDGIDFYFANRGHCMKFVDFLQSIVPVKVKQSKQLISQDDNSNTYNYKYSFAVDIAMTCKDDLTVLPKQLSSLLGGAGPLMLCTKVSSLIQLIDPLTFRSVDITANQFWKYPFRSFCTRKQLTEFTVLDIEVLPPNKQPQKTGAASRYSYLLAEVEIVRSADFGVNDNMYRVTTHLGNILKPGDLVLGYDLTTLNINQLDLDCVRDFELPDIVLIRKEYPSRKNRKRAWKLQQMDKEESDMAPRKQEVEKTAQEFEEFLQDLEEDPEMRSHVNIFRDPAVEPEAAKPAEDEEYPDVPLEELLDGLNISAAPDDEEEVELPASS
eukprot:GILI01012531.1.p1 GENE.GILI01012531.1~~GILI01012531.1.p1  ORF type:complete len:509 (-),score=136.37 GILI01012531.1:78-1604(-)